MKRGGQKVPTWVWVVAGAGVLYLLTRSQAQAATVATTASTAAIPSTAASVNTAAQEIGTGLTELFS